MCEANVYLIDENGEEKLLLEAVDRIVPEDESLIMENIYGQRKTVKARIKEMQLVEHRIVLTK
jgi:predicted RNA-binding protein